ncbi:MAG: PAS domain S-box protein [Candidatus Nealsonbacteria bacterium]|nr:PAS domain S-box protein [Candidatus Nealsonbacteria bacterium]
MHPQCTRILLVEDDEGHTGLIRRSFKSQEGVELTVATTLQEARQCLREFSPSVVITDLRLPDGKGIELLCEREKAGFPVLIMTSFGNEQAAVEAMKAGALDYVVKSTARLKDMPHIVERALREWGEVLNRRQAEEELQQARNQAREYLDVAAVTLLSLDVDGVVTLLNRKGHEVLGYEPGELIGRDWFDTCLPAEERHELRRAFDDILASERVIDERYENRVVTKSGKLRAMCWHNTLLTEDAGAVIGMLSSGEDVTEQKQMKEDLQEAHDGLEKKVEARTAELAGMNQELQAIYDGMVDGLLIADAQSRRFVRANQAICRMLGYSEDELLSMSIDDIHPPDDLPYVLEKFEAQAREQIERAENIPVRCQGGGIFYADIDTKPVVYRGRPCVIGFFRDITERKEAEQAIQENERKFRALFETSNDAVMLLDEKSFFDCNDATLRIFGCSSHEEFFGKHPGEMSPDFQPDGTDSRTAAAARIASAIETGSAHFEWLHRRIDGTEFMADVLLSSVDLHGKTVLQAVVRDISERKRAEEAVLRERETLQSLLESSDRDRKLTAYEIHDGFTQHITGAKMQLEAFSQLKDENPEVAAHAFQQGLDLVARGMTEARRLISGLRPPILDEAGVVAAIEHLANDVNMQKGPEVDFVFNVTFERLEPLLENAVFRIVQESVTNACRYSRSSKVQVKLTQQDDRVRIEVRDWGVGFDPDNITDTSFGIRGIKERARLLGGQAAIESTPGNGTLLSVTLPLVESRTDDGS